MSEPHTFYFGSLGDGHFVYDERGQRGLRALRGVPWSIAQMDTGLLKARNVPDRANGRVHWTCGAALEAGMMWFAFVWWDRSADARPGSNSGLYVLWPTTAEQAREQAAAAFKHACERWPHVIQRQRFELILAELP